MIAKSIGISIVIFTFLVTGCQSNKSQSPVPLGNIKPVVMEMRGKEIFQYWEFDNSPAIWEPNQQPVSALKSYHDSLESVLGKDALQVAVQKEASQSSPADSLNSKNGDLVNAQLVHSGTVGKVRPVNFLEAQLLNYQLGRYPLLGHPTEFHGFILLNDSSNRVKVYFAASDQPWPPKPRIIMEAVSIDLKHGWALRYHLHNHYEPKSNNYVGILAPSMADAQFFASLAEDFHLKNALITNGFYTVEVESKDLPKFRAHGH